MTARATAALTKLKPIRTDDNISLGSKANDAFPLISISPYACESRSLTAELKTRTLAFEMRYYQVLLHI